MLQGIFHAVRRKLSFDLIAGTSHTGAGRVAALYHKALDDPVKDKPVIKAVPCKLYKILHRDRRRFRIKLKRHHAAVFHFNNRFCHMSSRAEPGAFCFFFIIP